MFYFFFLFYLLKFSLTLDINNDQCSIRDTCKNLSNYSPSIYDDEFYIQSRNCFCDSICEQYGDCCSNSNILQNKQYQCIDFLLPTIDSKIMPFNRLSVWMRNQCLPIYIGSQIDKQCRNLNNQSFDNNPILYIPVTSLKTNITYRNYYCAYCNNDLHDNLEFWEYKTFCYGDGTDKDYLILNNDDDVQYYIYNLTKDCSKTILYPHKRGNSQPSVFIRPCKNSLSTNCPLNTSNDLAKNCSSYGTAYRYLKNSSLIYENIYCAQCNHPDNIEDITCFDPSLSSSIPPITLIRTYPLSILFDPNLLKSYLNNNTIPRTIYSINYNCDKSDELYDLLKQKCTQIKHSNEDLIISLKCSYPMQTILQLNQTIFYNNGSLKLINESIFLNQNDYVILNDNQIIFCADQWLNKFDLFKTIPFYRDILSIICTSISLMCLILFIIIFYLIPSLHNLPGKCLLFLSISLFFGQLLFISTSSLIEMKILCFISAILIHFFYLSSFSWLLIISIQIYLTFNQQIILESKNEKKNFRLFIYNILVWSLCGIVILIAGLIQYFKPESAFSPGYGTVFCSISKANSMIIFFLVPIGCILLIVTILFIKTLLTIFHSHKIAKLANITSTSNKKDRNLVFVYARLSSLMGIQWILLIVALIIGQTWLWIIFEIINSLPGLFICLGFLCSKRILNNLKEKLSLESLTRKVSSRSNTTTSTSLMSPPMNIIKKKFHF